MKKTTQYSTCSLLFAICVLLLSAGVAFAQSSIFNNQRTQRQLEQQQGEINVLKRMVCRDHPNADLCKASRPAN